MEIARGCVEPSCNISSSKVLRACKKLCIQLFSDRTTLVYSRGFNVAVLPRIRQGPFLSGQLQPWDSILQLQQQNLIYYISVPKPGWTQPIQNTSEYHSPRIVSHIVPSGPILSHSPMASPSDARVSMREHRILHTEASQPQEVVSQCPNRHGPCSHSMPQHATGGHSSDCNARLCPGMPPTPQMVKLAERAMILVRYGSVWFGMIH